jgi:predicted ATPase
MRWEVQLLGGFAGRRGDVVLSRLPTEFALRLLARLLLEPRRAHPRDELALWLWPHIGPRKDRVADDEAGIRRKRLRQTLAVLKALLDVPEAPTTIIATRESLRLNADAFDVDVRRLEACVAARDRDGAAACYRGPLLPGLDDDWVEAQRQRIDGLLGRLDDDTTLDPVAAALEEPRVLVPYVTPFIGRQAELRELVARVSASRLLAIIGPGGCGKTRLSARVAETVTGFDTVHFVGLADCTLPQQIEDRIGTVLQLHPGDMPMLEQIAARLSRGPALLVMDNFEQLGTESGEAVLARLLERLPRTHLLVSSRRALLRPEAENFMLLPLPLPDVGSDAATAQRSPALALFVDRARAARVGFHVHERNVATLVDICRALEGLPLAIELAASRVRDFAVGDIGRALSSGLHVLAQRGPRAARAGRHASLEVALDWSWRLLDDAQREALSALTVFRGGFTADQADDVVQGADHSALAALLRDSLVHLQVQAEADGARRLRLMASVREFVTERAAPDLLARMRARHRAHFGRIARRLQRAQRVAAADDLPNFVAAMESGLADGEASSAVALALALQIHWAARGVPTDAMTVLSRIVEQAAPGTPGHFSLLCLLPRLLVHAGQVDEAHRVVERALAAAGDDAARCAEALLSQTAVRWMAERDAPALMQPATEALQLARASSLPVLQARAAWLLGAVTLNSDNAPAVAEVALGLFKGSEQVFTAAGDRRGALMARSGLIAGLIHLRRWSQALALIADGEAEAARLQDLSTQLQMCSRLSTTLEALRRFDEAVSVCQRHVRLAEPQGQTYQLAYGLWNQCRPRARLRQPELAARLMAFSVRFWTETFGPLERGEERDVAVVRRLVAHQVGAAREAELWQEGWALSLPAAVALAS